MINFGFKRDDSKAREADRAYLVLRGDKVLGHIEQVESTKTGFRRGYCIGQVPCKVWRAYDVNGKRTKEPRDLGGFSRGHSTRQAAAESLVQEDGS